MATSRRRRWSRSMARDEQMNSEAMQHLAMAKLLRRKALHLADPRPMRRTANSFVALAKMVARHAKNQARGASSRHHGPAISNLHPPEPASRSVPSRPIPIAPLSPIQAWTPRTLFDQKKLLGLKIDQG